MKIIEVYEYYGRNWARISRELGLGVRTPYYWRQTGYIPYRAQVMIEKFTNGALIADMDHDLSANGQWKKSKELD